MSGVKPETRLRVSLSLRLRLGTFSDFDLVVIKKTNKKHLSGGG